MDFESRQTLSPLPTGDEPNPATHCSPKEEARKSQRKRGQSVKKFDREKFERALLVNGIDVKEWIKSKKYRPSRGTKRTMDKTDKGSTSSVEIAAVDLGLAPDGLWFDPPVIDQPLNLASDNTRREFVEQLAGAFILPETLDADGHLIQTDVTPHLRRIAKNSAALYNYHGSDPELFLKHAIGLLKRDSFVVASNKHPNTYHIRILPLDECRKDIGYRVDIEMLFATPRILLAQQDHSAKDALLQVMNRVLMAAPNVLHRGRGFRNLDQHFHCIWPETVAGREIIVKTIESSDCLYLRWRFLSKVYYGDTSAEYVQVIKQFNQERLDELKDIRAAIINGGGPDKIKDILIRHAKPALWLLRRCEELILLIKKREHAQPCSHPVDPNPLPE